MADPSSVLVASVIREASLHSRADWETNLRQGFARLGEVCQSGSPDARHCAKEQLAELNRRYRTRYPSGKIEYAASLMCSEVSERGWWSVRPPSLFDVDSVDAQEIANAVPEILSKFTSDGNMRPYSPLTKFLFFCFPETFPIYDSWAAEAIQMWSYLAFETRGSEWDLFSWAHIADPSGSGYRGIVEFYRRLWRSASPDQQEQLKACANEAQVQMGARVTVLDLIDKLLWRAGGDPVRLGLRADGWTLTTDALWRRLAQQYGQIEAPS